MNVKRMIGLLSGIFAAATVYAASVPQIVSQPNGQTVELGGNATFSVIAVNPEDAPVLEMIWCDPGIFEMGSPEEELGRGANETQHQVILSKGFWIGKYEVTQAQYAAIMGINPSVEKFGHQYGVGENYPVYGVRWKDATNFCAKLTVLEKDAGRLPDGYEYMLPTEAQWEYACRAGTVRAFNSEKNLSNEIRCSNMNKVGWYLDNSDNQSHPVGERRVNNWWIYDMHGNVAEWCRDCCDYSAGVVTSTYVDGISDPLSTSGDYHIMRGGAWNSYPGECRSADRYYGGEPEEEGACTHGFRVALVQVLSVSKPKAEEDFSIKLKQVSYQWKKDGIAIEDATDATYMIENVGINDSGNYTVTIGNSAGSVTSSVAELTVLAKPIISTHPQSQSVSINKSVTLRVTAKNLEGELEPSIEMAWCPPGTFWMGSSIDELGRKSDETRHQVVLNQGFLIGKKEVSQLLYKTIMDTNPAKKEYGTTYGIGDSYPVYGVSWSDATNFCEKFTIQERFEGRIPRSYKYTLPTEAQWEYACRAGTTTSLNCGYDLTSEYKECPYMNTVGWYRYNSSNVVHPAGQKEPNAWGIYDMHGNVQEWCLDFCSRGVVNDMYGVLTDTYSEGIEDPLCLSGSYRVLRGGNWQEYGSDCRSAARSCGEPSSYNAQTGFRVALVPINEPDTLNYQWYKDGIALPGATGTNIVIDIVKPEDAGRYTVAVSNTSGTVMSLPAVLTVVEYPKIITQPTNQTVNEEATVFFSVTASGTDLMYQWYKNGSSILNATNAVYRIDRVRPTDVGNYSVIVRNDMESVTSDIAVLKVTIMPKITTQPVGNLVNEDDSFIFSVSATGTDLKYLWYKDDIPLTVIEKGNPTYMISRVRPSDAGSYKVTVSNSAGSVTSEVVVLYVFEKPVILVQPAAQTVTEGDTVTFSVKADGGYPLSYQWYKNGVEISRAVYPTYSINSVNMDDNGTSYTVEVSNDAGKVTSDIALLTVQKHIPPLEINRSLETEWIILFTGELQESKDLLNWNTISNATNGVYKLDFKQTKKFYRSTR